MSRSWDSSIEVCVDQHRNHGYLPHNGVASIEDLIQGTYDVFGMAQDLSGFLAVYGAIFDGNLQGYSIGGPSINEPVLNGLLGTPTGLSGSHNKYENDASPIRGDLYTYGNDYENQVSLFQQFFDYEAGKSDEEANFGLDDIEAFRVVRFQDSIDSNPYFFNGASTNSLHRVLRSNYANKHTQVHFQGSLRRRRRIASSIASWPTILQSIPKVASIVSPSKPSTP